MSHVWLNVPGDWIANAKRTVKAANKRIQMTGARKDLLPALEIFLYGRATALYKTKITEMTAVSGSSISAFQPQPTSRAIIPLTALMPTEAAGAKAASVDLLNPAAIPTTSPGRKTTRVVTPRQTKNPPQL